MGNRRPGSCVLFQRRSRQRFPRVGCGSASGRPEKRRVISYPVRCDLREPDSGFFAGPAGRRCFPANREFDRQ